MHPTAEEGFRRMLFAARFSDDFARPLRVLDVGGADVNGTVHTIVRLRRFHELACLDVLDIEPGPGVTIVADATDLDVWRKLAEGELYDLVITTETFEHVKDWSVIVAGVSAALRPGGWFVGTCASVGRRPHGARGAHCPAPDEWYANIAPDALVASLMTSNFRGEVVTEYSWRPSFPTTNDLYWRAQR